VARRSIFDKSERKSLKKLKSLKTVKSLKITTLKSLKKLKSLKITTFKSLKKLKSLKTVKSLKKLKSLKNVLVQPKHPKHPKIEPFWWKGLTVYSYERMEQRIKAFEEMWRSRLPIPVLLRAPVYEDYAVMEFPRPELRRCTNQHEALPDDFRTRWDEAKTYEEKDAILMEYEATTW